MAPALRLRQSIPRTRVRSRDTERERDAVLRVFSLPVAGDQPWGPLERRRRERRPPLRATNFHCTRRAETTCWPMTSPGYLRDRLLSLWCKFLGSGHAHTSRRSGALRAAVRTPTRHKARRRTKHVRHPMNEQQPGEGGYWCARWHRRARAYVRSRGSSRSDGVRWPAAHTEKKGEVHGRWRKSSARWQHAPNWVSRPHAQWSPMTSLYQRQPIGRSEGRSQAELLENFPFPTTIGCEYTYAKITRHH